MRSTITIVVLVAVILASAFFGWRSIHPPAPKRSGPVKTVSQGRAVAMTGVDYLMQLHKAGRLPGLGPNEHGRMDMGGSLSSYPYSLTARFMINGEAVTNYYTIEELTKDSGWQFKRAWQVDAQGQTNELTTTKH